MNFKQFFIIIILILSITVPALHAMDDRPTQQELTLAENILKTMSEACPEAIRIVAADWVTQRPGIEWRELLDFYTTKKTFGEATLPMIQAIWKEICNVRFEQLRKTMFAQHCAFHSFPKEFVQAIHSFKDPSNPSPTRALIIVDPGLAAFEYSNRAKEAITRLNIFCNFMGTLLGAPIESYKLNRFWDGYSFHFTATPTILYFSEQNGGYNNDPHFLQQHSENFHNIINYIIKQSKHFVVVATFDPGAADLFKNTPGVAVFNMGTQTLEDRLVTLEDIEKYSGCPTEITQNLHQINSLIPEIIPPNEHSLFASLAWILEKAQDIFLTNSKFDTDKARHFFAAHRIGANYYMF